MDQISILDALVALELSWWRLGKFEKVLGKRFGTVLSVLDEKTRNMKRGQIQLFNKFPNPGNRGASQVFITLPGFLGISVGTLVYLKPSAYRYQ